MKVCFNFNFFVFMKLCPFYQYFISNVSKKIIIITGFLRSASTKRGNLVERRHSSK